MVLKKKILRPKKLHRQKLVKDKAKYYDKIISQNTENPSITQNKKEIMIAIFRLYGKIYDGDEEAIGLLQRGINFVAVKKGHDYFFIPAKVAGYFNRELTKNGSNGNFMDGRPSTKEISKILGVPLIKVQKKYLNEISVLESKLAENILLMSNGKMQLHNKKHGFWVVDYEDMKSEL
ncbi:hypothetical protein EH196_07165 [Bacillus sp. C1-1]|nr:hypothetical protein EH196_07165 [Bacillus sp. C1-1]